jgi:hypothetical protein
VTKKNLKVIGWREWVSLPGLGIPALKVKVDSGARTCALHATKIRYKTDMEGTTWVSFEVSADAHHVRVRAPLIEKRRVKSSMGHSSIRPVIWTEIQVGEHTWPTEITLVNRDPMGFRMLLGRQALRGRFLIHPSRSFLQSPTSSQDRSK